MAKQEADMVGEPRVLGIYHININATDLERSRAFYELLGFRMIEEFGQAGQADLDRGLGLPFTDTRAYFMGFGQRFETVIDLVEWKEPRATGKPLKMNDIGMPRMALRVKNIDALYAKLKAQGVEFLTEPQTLDFLKRLSRFVCCKDPDGVIIEFVELFKKA
ncbi:MAG TPA: VOC family protein [Stellaceae bacterium]|nr:VOC family protein [Stellaceae bacterium]